MSSCLAGIAVCFFVQEAAGTKPSSRPSVGFAADGNVKAFRVCWRMPAAATKLARALQCREYPTKEKSEANQRKELCRDLGVTRAALAAGLRLLSTSEECGSAAQSPVKNHSEALRLAIAAIASHIQGTVSVEGPAFSFVAVLFPETPPCKPRPCCWLWFQFVCVLFSCSSFFWLG